MRSADRQRMYPKSNRTGTARNRASTMTDYSVDNFSYDRAHLQKWSCPTVITVKLPDELQATVKEFERAGAAVCSAFDRIKELDDESLRTCFDIPVCSLFATNYNHQCGSG